MGGDVSADVVEIERRTVGSATALRCPACRRLILTSPGPLEWQALNAHMAATPDCQTQMADER